MNRDAVNVIKKAIKNKLSVIAFSNCSYKQTVDLKTTHNACTKRPQTYQCAAEFNRPNCEAGLGKWLSQILVQVTKVMKFNLLRHFPCSQNRSFLTKKFFTQLVSKFHVRRCNCQSEINDSCTGSVVQVYLQFNCDT